MTVLRRADSRLSRTSLAVAAGAVTILLLLACFPPVNLGWLGWVALVPLLLAIPRLSFRGVEWIGFLTGFALYGVSFRWFWAIFGFPAVALWGLLALFFAAFCVLVRTLPEGMKPWQRALLTACFWVAVEFVRCEQWPLRFSWLALGYSQHNQIAMPACAPLVGVYGLSFIIVMLNASLVCQGIRARVSTITCFMAMCAALSYNDFHRSAIPAGPGSVVAVQTNSGIRSTLFKLSREGLAKAGRPAIVCWPEYAVQTSEAETPDAYAEIRAFARKEHATLVFGGIEDRGGERYSSAAFVVGPDGKELGVYEKHDPLPFFKDGEPGSAYPVFPWSVEGKSVPFGVTICYDMSFARNVRELARNGARFVLVPSEEPPEWPAIEQAQHAIVAPMRAAENGIGIVRVSTPGPSQSVDPEGVVRSSFPAGSQGVLVEAPALGSGRRTAYNRAGWMLPWVCQFVTLAWIGCCLAAVRRRRRGNLASGEGVSIDVVRTGGSH